MNVAELARIARTDLTTILDLARWAHNDAYTRNTPNPDAKRPIRIVNDERAQRAADQDPTVVPGDTYDLGIGSHPSRRAWQVSIDHLAHAERYTATALHLATGERPRLIKPTPASQLPDVERTIHQTRARLGRITNAPPANGIHPALVIVVAHTEKAWGALNLAFTRGKADPATQAVGEPMCIICGIRPRAEKSGKRCNTCYSWWRRNRKERPTTLDGGGKEPLRAQARRYERGDGWGDESASCTQPLRPPDPIITGRTLLGPIPEPQPRRGPCPPPSRLPTTSSNPTSASQANSTLSAPRATWPPPSPATAAPSTASSTTRTPLTPGPTTPTTPRASDTKPGAMLSLPSSKRA